MAKFFVEDTEIKIIEKTVADEEVHKFKGDYYIKEATERTTYKSTLYCYGDISVLVSKVKQFNEQYYKIVLFNDNLCIGWPLSILSTALDVKLKRLKEDIFLLIGESNSNKVVSQVSFCKLTEKGKVNEIIINFTKLNDIQFVNKEKVIICYDDYDKHEDKTTHFLSLYDAEGKFLKTFFEYCDDNDFVYSYELKGEELKINKSKKEK